MCLHFRRLGETCKHVKAMNYELKLFKSLKNKFTYTLFFYSINLVDILRDFIKINIGFCE